MKDQLGDRMKDFYEDRTRFKLARRTNTIIRIDGKAFHTYTKGLQSPFDAGLIEDMNKTTEYLCQNIQGAKFGYVQSDEISILITDYDDITTHAWFDGNLQKMASIAASLATCEFNRLRTKRYLQHELYFNHNAGSDETPKVIINDPDFLENWPRQAQFDARVFQIPYQEEVLNYFIWRQQDATRNSISSVAQSLYSTKELHGKKTNEMQEMIFQKDINWNDYTPREKRGGLIRRVEKKFVRRDTDAIVSDKTSVIPQSAIYTRNVWEADPETPIFSQDKGYLRWLMPKGPDDNSPMM
jgi:tRNA(His) guanylyltransferase